MYALWEDEILEKRTAVYPLKSMRTLWSDKIEAAMLKCLTISDKECFMGRRGI